MFAPTPISEGHTQLYIAEPHWVCRTDEDVIMKIPSHLEKKNKIELLQTKYICFFVAIN